VPDDPKRAAHLALVDRILHGAGHATAEERADAFAGGDTLPAPLRTLIGKVTTTPVQVTDADVDAAKAAGISEDELFELIVCAAVGHASRLYTAGLTALAEVTRDGQAG
jgi:alkylhydroperoxidase/carboxymuconolactone decarboxylase family protein YurZ